MKKQQRPDFKERSFGLSVGTVLMLIAAYALWRERMMTAQILGGVGAVLVLLGRFQPRLLKWPSAVWWKFAMILGYINARVILTLAFALVLAPLGVLWRIIGKDPLARHRKNWQGWSPSPERYRNPDHFNRMY